ncbi:Protein CBG16019 [Caenorhabditis briggsae]|uniref:Protein CBG16019 n=1 Tax=Caenorhabditis briggsae TaxID=6238 RepID=A8XN97_CAEBR|nr:Protein CBG16019 [Caenorhabditis briggsae]CAP34328.2 Protein CBG16019 [Caenorhabditis briggsae]
MAREDPYDKPLDPEDVKRCLQKVRQNQAAKSQGEDQTSPDASSPTVPSNTKRPEKEKCLNF